MSKALKEWEEATEKLRREFLSKYFPDYSSDDWFWVGDVIGDVLFIGDYFFNLDIMIESLRFNATDEQLFEYYDKALELAFEDKPVGQKYINFLKYGWIL